jgi:hypothetical protein
VLDAQASTRLQELVPIRYGRMLLSKRLADAVSSDEFRALRGV